MKSAFTAHTNVSICILYVCMDVYWKVVYHIHVQNLTLLFSMCMQIIAYQPYGRSVDWWAYGVLLYEMLAGQVRQISIPPTSQKNLSSPPFIYGVHVPYSAISFLFIHVAKVYFNPLTIYNVFLHLVCVAYGYGWRVIISQLSHCHLKFSRNYSSLHGTSKNLSTPEPHPQE